MLKRHLIIKLKRRTKGFTLIEVLVALAVMAITGVAILKVTQEHIMTLTSVQELSIASWVANNQMTESTLRAQVKWPLKNNHKGEVEMAGKTWFWQQTVAKTPDDNLFQLTIIVATDEEMNDRVTDISTFISRPLT